jgi:adenosylhomocysteinase
VIGVAAGFRPAATPRRPSSAAQPASHEDQTVKLELSGIPHVYKRSLIVDNVTRYQATGHYFYLMNNGNAVNFLHGASVGPFIFLVQAEILAAVNILTRDNYEPGMHEVPESDRAAIAAIWLSYFNR